MVIPHDKTACDLFKERKDMDYHHHQRRQRWGQRRTQSMDEEDSREISTMAKKEMYYPTSHFKLRKRKERRKEERKEVRKEEIRRTVWYLFVLLIKRCLFLSTKQQVALTEKERIWIIIDLKQRRLQRGISQWLWIRKKGRKRREEKRRKGEGWFVLLIKRCLFFMTKKNKQPLQGKKGHGPSSS